MEREDQNIDDLFRDALDDYTESPPPVVWNSLQGRLANTPGTPGFKGRIVWMTLVLLVLVISVPTIQFFTRDSASHIAVNDGQPGTGSLPTRAVATAVNPSAPATSAVPQAEATQTPSQQSSNNTGNYTNNSNNSNNDDNNSNGPDNHTRNKQIAGNTTRRSNTQATVSPAAFTTAAKPVGNTLGDKVASATQDNTNRPGKTNSYSSKLSQPAPADDAGEEAQAVQPAAANTEKKQQDKKDNSKKDSNDKLANSKKAKAPTPKFDRIEAGVKLGYESGFDNYGGKKAVISPYLQYNFSPKISIITQPAFKYASLATTRIGNASSYYKENNDSTVKQLDTSTKVVNGYTGEVMFYITHFGYGQTHDSIIKSSVIGGTYAEVELPILLKYQLSKTFSVYAGANIIYSRSMAITENTKTFRNILKTVNDTFQVSPGPNPQPIPTSQMISYTGNDISTYTGPQYSSKTTDQWRVGYMLGFSYNFYDRWLFDALIQQANASQNVKAGINVNQALSVPYFRLTLGYKLIK